MTLPVKPKDPDADKDYDVKWAALRAANDGGIKDDGWLQGAGIATSEWFYTGPDEALTLHDDDIGDITGFDDAGDPATFSANTRPYVFVSGGTAGEDYVLTNRITTDETPPRTDDRSMIIRVAEQ